MGMTSSQDKITSFWTWSRPGTTPTSESRPRGLTHASYNGAVVTMGLAQLRRGVQRLAIHQC